jgi:hypothetical protein
VDAVDAVDADGQLWVSVRYTFMYNADVGKVRTVQFCGAGVLSPTSLSFSAGGRLLVTPGCYEFAP